VTTAIAVVDTNVVLVANGQHSDVSPACIKACVMRLNEIMREGKLVLDEQFLILLEYQNKTQPKKGNRPGDAFVKWALQNRCNTKFIDQVTLTQNDERDFDSFPDDPELRNFDQPDRKFVAVAGAHPNKPPIYQAADSKWLDWFRALERHGVKVEFLCPSDIEQFHRNKFGS
jgi:hypothetical protein